jgi:hypothetical protein
MATGADQYGQWDATVAVPTGTVAERDLPTGEHRRSASELAVDQPADHSVEAEHQHVAADHHHVGADHDPRPAAQRHAGQASEHDAESDPFPVHDLADPDGIYQAEHRVTQAQHRVAGPERGLHPPQRLGRSCAGPAQ